MAQTKAAANASLELVIKDPSGALIHRAQVELLRNSKTESTAETNQKGEAKFNRLNVGQYQARIEAPGFKPRDLNDLELTAGTNRFEVSLEIEAITADVEVSE